jgi:hypothetical protein
VRSDPSPTPAPGRGGDGRADDAAEADEPEPGAAADPEPGDAADPADVALPSAAAGVAAARLRRDEEGAA